MCIALNCHVSLAFFNLEHSLIFFPNLTLILRSSGPFSYRILQSRFIQVFHTRKLKLKSLHENSSKVFPSLSWDIWCQTEQSFDWLWVWSLEWCLPEFCIVELLISILGELQICCLVHWDHVNILSHNYFYTVVSDLFRILAWNNY